MLTPTTPPPMTSTRTCVFMAISTLRRQIDLARGLGEKLRYIARRTSATPRRETRSAPVRHRTISAFAKHGARAHVRPGRRSDRRSSGQPALSSAAASRAADLRAIWRWLTSTSECGRSRERCVERRAQGRRSARGEAAAIRRGRARARRARQRRAARHAWCRRCQRRRQRSRPQLLAGAAPRRT